MHSEDDDQTKGSHTHVEDGDDEREDSRSRLGLKMTTKRTSRKTKPSGRINKRTSKQQPVATTEDEDDFMSVSSSCADSDHQNEQIEQHHQQPQTASTAVPASSSSSPHLSTAPSTSNAAAAAAASSGGTGSSTSATTKSKKNRVTVLSDVPLNMNEYLDLVGNIVASSRIGAARPFAAVAPIPLVKVEKEEPLDDYDGAEINMEEQKPSLDHASGSSSSNSSSNERGTTSVIRMASTSANGNNSSPEDLTQAALTPMTTTAMSLQAIKVEVEATKLLPQRFTAPAQQRGPKKLVIKPKATATASAATATTTTKKTDNNAASSSSSSSSTSKICVESLSISAKVQGPTGELVQIKSERTEASGSSILEKHLTTSYATTQQQQLSRKHSSVNDEDARVLLEFANSNSKQQQAQSGHPFVVNAASFASAGSVFANASGSPSARNSNRGDEYILPDDNDLEVDEIVISSSSSFASTSQQQQQEQTHHQPTPIPQAHLQPPGFNDFNFLYHQNTSAITATTTASNFTPFGLQQQQQQHQQHGSSEATNAATLASSSSNSSALDHDSSMNATFRVAKPQSSLGGWYHAHDQAEPQSQQQQQQAHTSTHGQNVEQSSNFIAALAAVDCCSVAVDSDASDAKYLDLDTCKREQLSNSSSHLPSVSASTSTTSSSFAAAATESSLVGGLGLNIRTDEKMPAKGEISEQESNCDIENSWSQSVGVLTIKLGHINNSYLNPVDVRRHITALL